MECFRGGGIFGRGTTQAIMIINISLKCLTSFRKALLKLDFLSVIQCFESWHPCYLMEMLIRFQFCMKFEWLNMFCQTQRNNTVELQQCEHPKTLRAEGLRADYVVSTHPLRKLSNHLWRIHLWIGSDLLSVSNRINVQYIYLPLP